MVEDLVESQQEALGVEELADADAGACGLVDVGGADAAAGGAEGALAASLLLEPVEEDVVGHDDVGAVADLEAVEVDAAGAEALDLLTEDVRVDDDAVADDAGGLGPEDAGGDEVELELALLVEDGVACVVAPGEAGDDVGVLGEVVDDLALSLVAPLAPDDGVCGHSLPVFLSQSRL